LGATIATVSVAMTDGSAFVGSLSFGAPFFDDGGVFALSGNDIIVNPSGPGIANATVTTVDQITIVATQP
jgi:hypothetical protein